MNPILLEILPSIKNGYCCSQLLMQLLLQGAGHENPQLLRAMHGLCYGMGGTEGPCGLLTGGGAVLGCFAGRGEDQESAHPSLAPIVHEYGQWFLEQSQGKILCCEVVEHLRINASAPPTAPSPAPIPAPNYATPTEQAMQSQHLCGQLLAQCWEKILDLLESYGVDMDVKA